MLDTAWAFTSPRTALQSLTIFGSHIAILFGLLLSPGYQIYLTDSEKAKAAAKKEENIYKKK